MTVTIIDKTHAIDKPIAALRRSIFLAGPSPRGDGSDIEGTWREEAVAYLESVGFDGHVFIPLPMDEKKSYAESVEWELFFLGRADAIFFWVPRDLKSLPGFTTNVEFGEWMSSGKVVLAYPEDAEKMRYLDYRAQKLDVPVFHSLEDGLDAVVARLGAGALRRGGETCVPLHIWQQDGFQSWYQAQRKAGNRLVGGKLLWSFVIPKAKKVFAWIFHADVYITDEDRIKTNEFVFTRSDISVVCAYKKGATLLETRLATIREFRTPARTFDGCVHELPGGSSLKPGEDPLQVAAHELEEETGLKVSSDRIRYLGSRQLASTLSSHVAHLYCVEATEEELASIDGAEAGVAADTEHTFVSVVTLEDVLAGTVPFDYSMIGMLMTALLAD